MYAIRGNHLKRRGAAVLAVGIALMCGACTKEKRVQLVIREDVGVTMTYFEPNPASNVPVIFGFPDVLADVLADYGYSHDDVIAVHIANGYYQTSNVTGAHDWTLSGSIEARRTDGIVAGPAVSVVRYADESIAAADGERRVAPLTSEGVALLKQAIEDYLAGGAPVLEFRISTSDVLPDPTLLDPMSFDLEASLVLHVVVETTISVPDPF